MAGCPVLGRDGAPQEFCDERENPTGAISCANKIWWTGNSTWPGKYTAFMDHQASVHVENVKM
ncbi:hypothetical protein E4U54_002548 [Claviceps lovelessii]|nr:hypothetical protein E4U54_002548 [Claviceps lovelessii]